MNVARHRIEAAGTPGVETGRDQSIVRWDNAKPSGTSGGKPGTSRAARIVYAVIAGVIFAIAWVNALSMAHDKTRGGDAYSLGPPLLWEMSSAVATIAFTPLIYFGVRWMHSARSWSSRVALAASITLLFSALHIGGMVALRKLAMAMADGSYTFGVSLSELVYEFRKDAVTCFLLGATLWLAARYLDRRATQGMHVSGAPQPQALWLRDGSKRIKIDPHDVIRVSSAGNYVEYSLANGQTHLIRGTLSAEEFRLKPFQIVRVHRARLVNLKRVSGLELRPSGDFELKLDSGQIVLGSRRYRSAVASAAALQGQVAVPTGFG
jgi:DNA-binding LytR/AlgR family response regulator